MSDNYNFDNSARTIHSKRKAATSQISQISLQDRLKRLYNGYPSDPVFAQHSILTMANTPLPEFFGDFSLLEDFKNNLFLSDEEVKNMTFKEAAWRIYRICIDKDAYIKWEPEIKCSIADLAIPLIRSWEERRRLNAKSKNSTV